MTQLSREDVAALLAPKFQLSPEDVDALLVRGDCVHVFQFSAGLIIGSDCPRQDLLDWAARYGAQLANPAATEMRHGVAVRTPFGSWMFADTGDNLAAWKLKKLAGVTPDAEKETR